MTPAFQSYRFPFSFLHIDGQHKTIMVQYSDADVRSAVRVALDGIKNNPLVIPVFFDGYCLASYINGFGSSGPIRIKVAYNSSDENGIYLQIEYEDATVGQPIRLSASNYNLADGKWYGLIPPNITDEIRKLVRHRKSDHVVKCLQQA